MAAGQSARGWVILLDLVCQIHTPVVLPDTSGPVRSVTPLWLKGARGQPVAQGEEQGLVCFSTCQSPRR